MVKGALKRFLHRLNGSERVIGELREGSLMTLTLQAAVRECQDRLADLESFALANTTSGLRIVTEHPVAIYSDDHKFPRGVRNDNSRHPRFVRAVEELFKKKVRHLDLGCSGGGLVLDFLLRGHESVGVEGGDFALREQRAEWRVIPHHLFTADITMPFSFRRADGSSSKFDVITAWEVLEHIPEARLPGLFGNLRENLADEGIFVASVATFEEQDPGTGAVWHVTVKPRDWWLQTFASQRFEVADACFHARDHVRGIGNPRLRWDWNVESDPNMGFHITLRKRAS